MHAQRCLVLAHRGLHDVHPENSVAAIDAAIRLGAGGVEVDVRRTADGVLVLAHDPDLHERPLASMTYAEVVAAAPWIPRLDEALAQVGGQSFMNVELKEHGYEPDVVNAVDASMPRNAVLFSSFDERTVASLKALDSSLPTGLLAGKGDDRRQYPEVGRHALHRAASLGADALIAQWELVDDGLAAAVKEAGLRLIVWTVNDAFAIERLARRREVEAIITDVPALALRLVCGQVIAGSATAGADADAAGSGQSR